MANLLSIGFPFSSGISSFPVQAIGSAAIQASIIQIISTKKGERPGRPNFGTNVMDYVFENNSDNTSNALIREIKGAISAYEPRVAVSSVSVVVDDVNEGQVLITINYRILQTGAADSITIGVS